MPPNHCLPARSHARWRRIRVVIPTIVAVLAIQGLAFAQTTPEDDPWANVEEMVVTSSGALAGLTDATTSVTAFDSEDLMALGASDVSDVAAFTPNLEIRSAGGSTATFFIRGVGLNDLTANASGSVAIYQDDAPKNLPAIQLGQLFDLDEIGILKGPQGAGPGRNASAGAIKIYTRQPTNEFAGKLRVDYGNYDALVVEGALNVPIVADRLSTRLSFNVARRDGYVTNRCGVKRIAQFPSICDDVVSDLADDLNNENAWAARMTTRWETPIDDMSWTFTFHGSRTDELGTVGEHLGAVNTLGSPDFGNQYQQPEVQAERERILATIPVVTRAQCRMMFPNDREAQNACRNARSQTGRRRLAEALAGRPLDTNPFEGDYNLDGYTRHTTWGALIKGEWELDAFRIKSITAFERYDRDRLSDFDYSPNVLFEFDIEDDAWQATQDLQFSGELEDYPISWSTGFFYLQERLDYTQFTRVDEDVAINPSYVEYIQDTQSLGVFASADWDFLDDFTLSLGGRYNWERKRFDAQIVLDPILSPDDRCLPTQFGPTQCTRTDTFDHMTGEVKVSYVFDDSRTMYMKYNHGWKGAQYNARDGRNRRFATDVADPETIDAFETGFEASWFDGRVSLDGALFWYKYKNYQVFTFTNNAGEPPQRVVLNADDAELYGAELEATIEPIDALVMDVRFGWLESRFLDFTDSVVIRTETQGNRRIVTDFNGNPLPNAPRFKIAGSISYALEVPSVGTITPRWDFTWTDDVAFDPSGGRGSPDVLGNPFMPANTIGQQALLLQNFRLGYAVENGGLEIAGWVRNLTNETYKTLAFDASAGPGLVGNLVGEPRTYGLSATFEF